MNRMFAFGLVLVASAVATTATQAQPYPNKPITLVISSAAGGAADFGARLYADIVGKALGQRIVVENRQGASGIIAAQYVQTTPPDGYTLMQIGSGLPEFMPAMQQLPFDPIKDFTYITPLFRSDNYVIVRNDLPANTIAEYIALAKSKPDGISVGDTGTGSPANLTMNMVRFASGAKLLHVHYRVTSDILADLAGGRLDSSNSPYGQFRPFLEDKKIRVLAVGASQRTKVLPNVPTLNESGLPNVTVQTWWGLLAPANLPKPILDRLSAEFIKASKDPELVAKLTEQDAEPFSMTPDEFVRFAAANQEQQGKVIRTPGFKVE